MKCDLICYLLIVALLHRKIRNPIALSENSLPCLVHEKYGVFCFYFLFLMGPI